MLALFSLFFPLGKRRHSWLVCVFCSLLPWILSLISKHPVHLLLSLPCKWNGKKTGARSTIDTNLSRLFTNPWSTVMLNQMYKRISKLSLCEAFLGLQRRHQHHCLIFIVIMSAFLTFIIYDFANFMQVSEQFVIW